MTKLTHEAMNRELMRLLADVYGHTIVGHTPGCTPDSVEMLEVSMESRFYDLTIELLPKNLHLSIEEFSRQIITPAAIRFADEEHGWLNKTLAWLTNVESSARRPQDGGNLVISLTAHPAKYIPVNT